MNCLEDENVCSVQKENNLGYYRLHTIWKNGGFFLNVTSRDGAWRGEMSASDVKKMSSQLDMEPEVYLKQCRDALTSYDGQPGMSYMVENGSFTWKKMVDEDSGIKIKMGSVMLQTSSFVDTVQNLVNAALNCNKKLQKEVNALHEEKQKHLTKNSELLKKINELIKTKEVMENDLYARFILLLNSKKKKIEELQEAVEGKEMIKTEKTGIKTRKSKKSSESHQTNPYEVDTENDDCDSEKNEPVVRRSARKLKAYSEGHEKVGRKGSPLPRKSVGEKKVKKSKDRKTVVDDDGCSSHKNRKDTFSEESMSSEDDSKKKSRIPSTREAILDYFYGVT